MAQQLTRAEVMAKKAAKERKRIAALERQRGLRVDNKELVTKQIDNLGKRDDDDLDTFEEFTPEEWEVALEQRAYLPDDGSAFWCIDGFLSRSCAFMTAMPAGREQGFVITVRFYGK